MAHTVESLSKLLKKTPDEVISILAAAGIEGKTQGSDISGDERKVLMANLSKRSGTKSSISVSRKTPKVTSTSGGVKIQVKKKRQTAPVAIVVDENVEEAAQKAQEALEAGKLAEEKHQEQDAKRHGVIKEKKDQEEARKTHKEQQEHEAKTKVESDAKAETERTPRPKLMHRKKKRQSSLRDYEMLAHLEQRLDASNCMLLVTIQIAN